MLDPEDLYELDPEAPGPQEVEGPDRAGPVLVHALTGFTDAGAAGRLAVDHLLDTLEHRVIARFDVDLLYDYRARRPPMTFVENRWTEYDAPHLELYLARDVAGTPFLLLAGVEPDVFWERCVEALRALVERFGVRLTVGLNAIPMAVPHTRPIGMSAHATNPELVAGRPVWVGRIHVPGHLAALLELRLGERGQEAAGFAVHVPHYLAQTEYPDAAVALVDAAAALCRLELPSGRLTARGAEVRAAIAAQVGEQPEVVAVVEALERQYDAFVNSGGAPLSGDEADLPTADELGAELERFLAEENERRGREG